eukprot:TRINITY_DN10424_c0_g1_i1.p1 TRINITY_DN10424_c0_g1~~TRINITY_DN10424_c0_g1_i1.p1  ORF type:complete len:579 (+),score=65.79 TRINITY_DN10424_c0_g1_i1:253-1737(+)
MTDVNFKIGKGVSATIAIVFAQSKVKLLGIAMNRRSADYAIKYTDIVKLKVHYSQPPFAVIYTKPKVLCNTFPRRGVTTSDDMCTLVFNNTQETLSKKRIQAILRNFDRTFFTNNYEIMNDDQARDLLQRFEYIPENRRRTRSMSTNLLREKLPVRDMITFPPPSSGRKDVITINEADFERLRPMCYLNDSLIDFYLKYLQLRGSMPVDKELFIFNSFFWTKLNRHKISQIQNNSMSAWPSVDIFQFKYLVIPINIKLHWSLVIVCNPGSAVESKERLNMLKGVNKPIILHLCSLALQKKAIFSKVRAYLKAKWNSTGKIGTAKFTPDTFPAFAPNVPTQENNHDCGLYLLHYAEIFCRNPPKDFSKNSLKKEFEGWFDKIQDVADKRQLIKDTITRIEAEQGCDEEAIDVDENDEPSLAVNHQSSEGTPAPVERKRKRSESDNEDLCLSPLNPFKSPKSHTSDSPHKNNIPILTSVTLAFKTSKIPLSSANPS